MSDSGDKTRRDAERGGLPRTNGPRPEPAQRRTHRHLEDEHVDGLDPLSARATRRSDDLDGPSAMMAERPTQLDLSLGGNNLDVRESTALKQVPLLRADGTPLMATEERVAGSSYVGCSIDGRYRIEGVLGRGGMGVVYRARHEVIDKLFAIKILLPTEDTEVVERFVNEARAATAIGNVHIVDTVDFGALPDGSTYFVMEYLEGETLARSIKAGGFIAVPRAIGIGKQIAEGMSAAHRAGIVHRDLKPENIFLTRRDEQEDFVKLLDFGIAKIERTQNRITRAGTIFGTPHYMSPEQASGTEVDARTDVYALGVILYEMLSGHAPFEAENPMGLLTQHLYTEPVPLGRVPAPPQVIPSALDAVVLKCLAKKANDRYASMAEFAQDLDCVYRGEPPQALTAFLARAERDHDPALVAAAKAELQPQASGRARVWLLGMGVAGIVGLGGVALTALRAQPPEVALPHAETSSHPSQAGLAVEPVARERSVALVFSPIDAEVFRDGRSLGGMPVTVRLAQHESAHVEIRREGFYAETVTIDGSRPVVVVRLAPIPGVEPRVPVPAGEPLEALRRSRDAGARPLGAVLYLHHDSGTPMRHLDRGDAGAPARSAPRASPGASAAAMPVPAELHGLEAPPLPAIGALPPEPPASSAAPGARP